MVTVAVKESGMKLLSIIIPTYNMEKYLAQCVESILRTPSLGAIEVVIVNDGSCDRSLSIAKRYAERYAQTIRVIDKENGNYGSTINAALPTLQGEYVKILDADDAFDGACIADFLAALNRLRGVDMVVTPYIECRGRSTHRISYNIYSRNIYEEGKVYDAERIFGDGAIRFFMMHSVCYRTEMLRRINYRQSEGVSYTDQEWVFYPLFRVRNMAFVDIALYRYNASREGQTMDMEVQLRSLAQLRIVTERMAQHFIAASRRLKSPVRGAFLRTIVADRIKIIYRRYLLTMSEQQFATSDFVAVDMAMMTLACRCKIIDLKVPVNNLLKVDLLDYWHRHRRRYTPALLRLLRFADRTMTVVHRAIFR